MIQMDPQGFMNLKVNKMKTRLMLEILFILMALFFAYLYINVENNQRREIHFQLEIDKFENMFTENKKSTEWNCWVKFLRKRLANK